MPVLRKTINLTVSGNALIATDSVTGLATNDAGVQGEDEAILFHVAIPTDWQDLSVRLKIISQDGGYDFSDLPVTNVISMPLKQGLTMCSGRLTVSLIGSTASGIRKSVDCKTLLVAASAQEIEQVDNIYPYPVRHITGSGGALVTQTSNDTYNINVTGTGGDMLQSNYANGSGQSSANPVDKAIYSNSSGSSQTSLYANHSAGLVGEIKAFGGSTAPTGTLLCNGAAVSRTTYADLFAAIGTAWGAGDGSTTFNLPSVAGCTLIGVGTAASSTVYTLGQKGGSENHTHGLSAAFAKIYNSVSAVITGLTSWHAGYVSNFSISGTGSSDLTTGIALGGNTDSTSNMQPWAAVNYVIVY
jgi:microcystin-dependent protein